MRAGAIMMRVMMMMPRAARCCSDDDARVDAVDDVYSARRAIVRHCSTVHHQLSATLNTSNMSAKDAREAAERYGEDDAQRCDGAYSVMATRSALRVQRARVREVRVRLYMRSEC